MSRDPLAEVLAESLNIVGPLRHIFGEAGAQVVDALEVLLAQEIEHAADQLRAFLASDETVGRVAGRMSGDLPEEPMWSLIVIARAALSAATEAQP